MMDEPKIYRAICNVMDDMGAVGKTSKNQQQGFMYRGIDAVMNALHPLMAKHRIFCTPKVLEQSREERTTARGSTLIYSICKVEYTFYAEDGSSVAAIVIGEGMDSGDKATNKAMAIAFKYACFQIFCIPTEEMVDPDGESHEVKPKSASGKKKSDKVDEATADKIYAEIYGIGIDPEKILAAYGVRAVKDMTQTQAENCLKRLEATKQQKGRVNESE